MKKTYKIKDETWWDGDWEVPCYNVDPDDFPITDCHSRDSVLDLIFDILVENDIISEPDWGDENFEIDWREVMRLFEINEFVLEWV